MGEANGRAYQAPLTRRFYTVIFGVPRPLKRKGLLANDTRLREMPADLIISFGCREVFEGRIRLPTFRVFHRRLTLFIECRSFAPSH
jgi:hypothetical protein